MRLRTIVLGIIGLIVLVIAGVAVFLLTLDVNQYKGRIAEAVKDATGRDLTLKGDIKLVVGFSPSLAVNDVAFANAPWGSRPQMPRDPRSPPSPAAWTPRSGRRSRPPCPGAP